MDFANLGEKWKNRPKIVFSDFLQGFWREKTSFENFAENWKNRSKIIFSDFLQDFWSENIDLEFLIKIEKIDPKSFFGGLSAGFLKGKYLRKKLKIFKEEVFFHGFWYFSKLYHVKIEIWGV